MIILFHISSLVIWKYTLVIHCKTTTKAEIVKEQQKQKSTDVLTDSKITVFLTVNHVEFDC